MNQVPKKRVEEIVEEFASMFKGDKDWFMKFDHQGRALTDWLRNLLAQKDVELQKAREGLKARIELLLENNTARDNMDFSHGYRNALLDIESYLSELDQDKK